MQESKQVKAGDTKLENIQVGDKFIHPWIEKTYEKEKYDGVGTCYKVISPENKEFVAVLLDLDTEDNPRFIFAYYHPYAKREFIIDTKHQFGWSIFFKDHCWKL
jgi:hypothetical protein